ncbi:hypothetical protein HK102_001228, partial [Quaeritorhiza haematococci]
MVTFNPLRAGTALLLLSTPALFYATPCDAVPTPNANDLQKRQAPVPGVADIGLQLLGISCKIAEAAGSPCPPEITEPLQKREVIAEMPNLQKRQARVPGVAGVGLQLLGISCRIAEAAGSPCPPEITEPLQKRDVTITDGNHLQKRQARVPGVAGVGLQLLGISCKIAEAAGSPCPPEITEPL